MRYFVYYSIPDDDCHGVQPFDTLPLALAFIKSHCENGLQNNQFTIIQGKEIKFAIKQVVEVHLVN